MMVAVCPSKLRLRWWQLLQRVYIHTVAGDLCYGSLIVSVSPRHPLSPPGPLSHFSNITALDQEWSAPVSEVCAIGVLNAGGDGTPRW